MLKLKLTTVLILLCIMSVVLVSSTMSYSASDPYLENVSDDNIVNSSPSIQMYFYIKKYAEKFSIPEPYAFSLAYQETRYGGPLDLNYNHIKNKVVLWLILIKILIEKHLIIK